MLSSSGHHPHVVVKKSQPLPRLEPGCIASSSVVLPQGDGAGRGEPQRAEERDGRGGLQCGRHRVGVGEAGE